MRAGTTVMTARNVTQSLDLDGNLIFFGMGLKKAP